MAKVKSLRSGRVYTVYGVLGNLFVLWKRGRWIYDEMIHYVPEDEE